MSDCIPTGTRSRGSRQAWIKAHGPIPDGLWVLHTCDHSLCINIEHLYLGTHEQNMADLKARGPGKSGTISCRLSKDEKNLLDDAAQYEGLPTGTWVRQLAMKAARDILKKIVNRSQP
jgi:hypothetical protein